MAGGAVGEGGGCASEDKLLGLGIADDDGIVMTAGRRASLVMWSILELVFDGGITSAN